MFAPVQAIVILLVIPILIAIIGNVCYKKRRSYRRKTSLSLNSEFVHKVHSPVTSLLSVHLEEPGSLSFPTHRDTTLRYSDRRYTGASTDSSITLQSGYSEEVFYVWSDMNINIKFNCVSFILTQLHVADSKVSIVIFYHWTTKSTTSDWGALGEWTSRIGCW